MRRLVTSLISILGIAVVTAASLLAGPVAALDLTGRTVELSTPAAQATNVSYNISFTVANSQSLGSIVLEFCTNYQFDPAEICQYPAGFDTSGATLTNQSGITDLTINPNSTNHILTLSRPAASTEGPVTISFKLTGLTNPTAYGSYYVRMSSHAATDGSDAYTDSGEAVFSIAQGVNITTEVPPYLLFCSGVTITAYDCDSAEGNFMNFGELSARTSRTASSQLVAATNAQYGYGITVAGTTMLAGTNVIPAMAGQIAQVGTSQFGINVRANTSPAVGSEPAGPGLMSGLTGYNAANRFRFASGETLAAINDSDDYRKLTVSYLVNISADQPAGNYVATLSYICLANF